MLVATLFVIGTLVVCTFVGLLFVGSSLSSNNFWLISSAATALGAATLLSLLRLISQFTNSFKLSSLLVSLIILVALALRSKSLIDIVKRYGKNIAMYCTALVLIALFCTLIRTIWELSSHLGSAENGLYAHWGATHAGRYINLSYDIVHNNRIPTVGQSYGQSVLVALGLLTGTDKGFLLLSLFVSAFTAVGAVFSYGLIQQLSRGSIGRTAAVMMVATLFFANTTLTVVAHVLTIDGGWPLISMGYVDLYIGLVLFIYLVGKALQVLSGDYRLSLSDYFEAVLVGICFNMVGAQFTCLLVVVIAALITCRIVIKDMPHSGMGPIVWIGSFILGSVIGAMLGGFLAPKAFLDNLSFQGMLESDAGSTKIEPYLPYYISHVDTVLAGNAWRDYFSNSDSLIVSVFGIEASVLEAIRIAFWPLFGVVSYYVVMLRSAGARFSGKEKGFVGLGGLLLFVGLIAAFFVSFAGNKWAMARFLLPGYYLGLLFALIASVKIPAIRIGSKELKVLPIVMLLMVCGSISDFVLCCGFLLNDCEGILGVAEQFAFIYSQPANIFY